jgi:hypothetical protein
MCKLWKGRKFQNDVYRGAVDVDIQDGMEVRGTHVNVISL